MSEKTTPSAEGDLDEGPQTLGDLLYADRTRPRIPEEDWRRLVHAIAAGDQHALHGLFERSHRLVYTLIMRIAGNAETAEELTLDVFHDVWRRASSYQESGGSVLGWIMNQARSRAIDRLRFETRKKRTQPPGDVLDDQAQVPDPAENFLSEAETHRIRAALTMLTPQERTAIQTAFFSELTYEEAAAQLNEPVGTIKSRIRSGLGKLRRVIGADEP